MRFLFSKSTSTTSSALPSRSLVGMITGLFYLTILPRYITSWSTPFSAFLMPKRCSHHRNPPRHHHRYPRSSNLLGLSSGLDGHKDRMYGIHDHYNETRDAANADRGIHNQKQAEVFDENSEFFAGDDATPPDVVPRLEQIVQAGQIHEGSRVLDVGTGVAVLIPYFEKCGVNQANITGVDLSPRMLEVAKRRYPKAEFWCGDIIDFPVSEATNGKVFDAVYFNAVFGNVWDQAKALEEVGELLARDGRVIISHPLGAAFVDELKRRSPSVVLTTLPNSMEELEDLCRFSRLVPKSLIHERELYIATFQRQPHRPLREALYLRGQVAKGYGRGSKKLGVPTANLPESLFSETLRDLSTGVYLGWASVHDQVCKAIVNVGYSPTFVGEENREKIVEAHLIDADLKGDFYDEEMRIVLAGFQRPELRFPNFSDLLKAIHQDVDDARQALDLRLYQSEGLLNVLKDEKSTSRWLPFKEWSA